MRWSRVMTASASLLALCNVSSFAADAQAGRQLFRAQCTVCHTAEPNDQGGAQGPSLIGAFGKAAASNTAFGYTQALRRSGLTWNAATLDRYLSSPTSVVPGTSMAAAITNVTDRQNLVAYLESVKDLREVASQAVVAGNDDWRNDRPGRTYKVTLPLARPFATTSIRNNPKVVAKPANAQLSVPAGFSVSVFTSDVQGPRRMIVAPNGDVIVTEMRSGRVSVLRQAGDGKSVSVTAFAGGMKQPFGLAFYPDAKNPQWLYVGESERVIRFPYRTGDTQARGEPEVVVKQLPPGVGHFTRDVVFSPDGKRMFVSVGSQSNVAEGMVKKSVAEAQAWEATRGLGAAWAEETDRAVVLVYPVAGSVDKTGEGKIFAAGIRNCVSLAIQPVTNDLWCTTNERDLLGDDLVPDYSTRVKEGAFYGWPWYYLGANEDPRLKGDRPDLASKVTVPDVLYQAHSAALNLTFYTANSGASAFPTDYAGDAFVAFHGSWNRNFRTGYKIVRVRFKNGVATGEYEDFMTGFIVDSGNVWGRPVATVQLQDGSLLVSDDASNQIFRVSYRR